MASLLTPNPVHGRAPEIIKLLFFSLVFLIISCNSPPQTGFENKEQEPVLELEPFMQDDLWGYRDSAGQMVIPPKFVVAETFSREGMAAVVDQLGWAYINKKGDILLRPFVFDNGPDPFAEGLARFVEDGRMGFFDRHGKVVIEAQFDFAMPFEDGKAKVCTDCREVAEGDHKRVEGGTWWLIDQAGNRAGDL